MSPDRSHPAQSLPRVQGFSLALALFIIVVLGLLATVLYRVIAMNQLSVVQETLSARAFLAADSGAQAGMMRLFPISGAAANCSAANQAMTVTGLIGCNVALSCSATTVNGTVQYQLNSTGSCVAGTMRASRTVTVLAQDIEN